MQFFLADLLNWFFLFSSLFLGTKLKWSNHYGRRGVKYFVPLELHCAAKPKRLGMVPPVINILCCTDLRQQQKLFLMARIFSLVILNDLIFYFLTVPNNHKDTFLILLAYFSHFWSFVVIFFFYKTLIFYKMRMTTIESS